MNKSLDSFLESKIDDYIRRDLVVIDEDSGVCAAVKLMEDMSIGSVIVTRNEKPTGIVTERDILYKVVSAGRNPAKTVLKEIMSSPLISVPVGTDVRKALETMIKRNVRRLLVNEGEKIVGIITQRSYVGDIQKYSVSVIDLELPSGTRCPYCNAIFQDARTLSKHIDNKIRVGFLKR